MQEFLVGFSAMLALMLLRVPIAFAMGIVGFIGLGLVRTWDAAIGSATAVIYETGFSYQLSVLPLFILMGNFVTRAGLSHELYRAAYAWIGHLRGGLGPAGPERARILQEPDQAADEDHGEGDPEDGELALPHRGFSASMMTI